MKKQGIMTVLAAIIVASLLTTQAYGLPEDFEVPRPGWAPGHPLYGLERFIEDNIEVPLARLRGRSAEMEKRMQLAEERLAEMEVVANGTNIEDLEDLRLGYYRQMNRTRELVNDTMIDDLDLWIANRTMNHIRVLTRVRARVPQQAWQGIDMALNVSAKGIGNQMRDMARRMDENNTRDFENLEQIGLRLQERIREYEALRNNGTGMGPQFGIGMHFDIEEFINRSRRGPP